MDARPGVLPMYIAVYGDNKIDTLSTKQIRLQKLSYPKIFFALRDKGVAEGCWLPHGLIRKMGWILSFDFNGI